jgi:hypothetical protein
MTPPVQITSQEILEGLGLEDIDHGRFDERKKGNANPKGTIPVSERITPLELDRIHSIATPMAEKLGYEFCIR